MPNGGIDNTSNDNAGVNATNQLSAAPRYIELVEEVKELREKLKALEAQSLCGTHSDVVNTSARSSNRVNDSNNYWILPNIGNAVPKFNGHETGSVAEDWIASVDGLANVNDWPFRYRLQYVRNHVEGAARSWFLHENFGDWDEFIAKFREAFIRVLRRSDRWQMLEN